MRQLALLIIGLVSFGFSIPVYVIEKEIHSKMPMGEQKGKEIEYIADGYVKKVRTIEMKTDMSKMLPFMKNMPQMKTEPKIQKREEVELLIYKGKEAVIYSMFPETKTYREQEMEGIAAALFLLWFYDCDDEGNCKPAQNLKVTNEFKNVGKWKARKIITKVKGFSGDTPQDIVMTQWLAKDKHLLEARLLQLENMFRVLEKDIESSGKLKADREKAKKMVRDAYKKVRELYEKYGAPVMVETKMPSLIGMGDAVSVETVKSVTKKNLPKNFFSVPKDYKPMGVPGQGMPPGYEGGYR
ncbi:hypothetical protein BCF55_1699 [Hydrogenivirga caldilitoris]|uniref:Uncharacterized protein n=1 Tax=Hydrogenivirga caldilitoris TaxID=246264 RepID=A0A497XQX6_9AQUI|nr:hypothetical protein [Hydrogenivirga caldilitoris]RLJ71397.1 hypothetical protein BCF55_1699 [Hydrogenivirga caldilitoris]